MTTENANDPDLSPTPLIPYINILSHMKSIKPNLLLIFVFLLAGAGCNAPPLYEKHAREFLQQQGVSAEIISRLTQRKRLAPAEVQQLAQYENVAVLHLLGANAGTPPAIISRLAGHRNFEVRTGIAVNPNTPLELLLSLREPGKYTTLNDMLARNPQLSPALLQEMYKNGETGFVSLGLNPNCPPEIMREIARKGNEIDRAWLARNPNLPPDLVQQLAQDESKLVRDYLHSSPNFRSK